MADILVVSLQEKVGMIGTMDLSRISTQPRTKSACTAL